MAGNDIKIKSNEGSPDTLLDIALKYIIENIEEYYEEYVDPENKMDIRPKGPEFFLPRELCERLLESHVEQGLDLNDRFAKIFTNYPTRLKYVSLCNSSITDSGLKAILQHDPITLRVENCEKLTYKSLEVLNEHSMNLKILKIGNYTKIVPDYNDASFPSFSAQGYILNAPEIRKLAIRSTHIRLPLLLNNLRTLRYLDLSDCSLRGEFEYLEVLPHLESLILYNVGYVQECLSAICKIKSLKFLDISQSSDRQNMYKNENEVLSILVESLPNLECLDISGTNLAGTGVAQHSPPKADGDVKQLPQGSDIPGLSSRASRPLEFLGLYGTHHAACRRHDIPAKMVSGDANEQQILTAADVYRDRPEILAKVLNDLYHLLRYETCYQINSALERVLVAMDKHVYAKHIQISGSATLFYIVKGKDKTNLTLKIRRHVIRSLLNGMAMHLHDDTMMRNGCLTLCQFKIPQDVLFQYEKLVQILLHGVSDTEQEGFVQRIAIYLLNSLACQVDNVQKQCLGDMGAISKMLLLINDRLDRKVCDDVLEVAWSTMWNVTDETSSNCTRFLDGKGMHYFLECLKCFPDKEELLRNMMGLLGNVAEVHPLRSRLMTPQFIAVFSDLLDSCSDGIEVSYNAAGVLAHIASDGIENWNIENPKREEVLSRMVIAIERWDLRTERNINYRSFYPILYLIRTYDTPECQHWAAWALANLTKVYPLKYCSLVESEGGLRLLNALLAHPLPYARVKELAAMVVENCRRHRETLGDPMVLEG